MSALLLHYSFSHRTYDGIMVEMSINITATTAYTK
jgi:hypothetical protein